MEGVARRNNMQMHQEMSSTPQRKRAKGTAGNPWQKNGGSLFHLIPLHQIQLWLLNNNNNTESEASGGKLDIHTHRLECSFQEIIREVYSNKFKIQGNFIW